MKKEKAATTSSDVTKGDRAWDAGGLGAAAGKSRQKRRRAEGQKGRRAGTGAARGGGQWHGLAVDGLLGALEIHHPSQHSVCGVSSDRTE